jgi:hypothetical protein
MLRIKINYLLYPCIGKAKTNILYRFSKIKFQIYKPEQNTVSSELRMHILILHLKITCRQIKQAFHFTSATSHCLQY